MIKTNLSIEKLEDKVYLSFGPAIPEGLEYRQPLPMPERPPIQVHTVPLPPDYNYVQPPVLPLFAK